MCTPWYIKYENNQYELGQYVLRTSSMSLDNMWGIHYFYVIL